MGIGQVWFQGRGNAKVKLFDVKATLQDVVLNNALYYIKVSGIASGNKLIKTIRYPLL